MPLNALAAGPLSAAVPATELALDDLEIDDNKNGIEDRTINITTEEKADPSHFALLKVLGQGIIILINNNY